MKIVFKTQKLMKICNSQKKLQKEFGVEQAKRIRLRLDELRAADTLSDISYLPPPRLHELSGDKKGIYSVDLKHPYRLLFEATEEEDSNADKLSRIRAIRILKVEDTHD